MNTQYFQNNNLVKARQDTMENVANIGGIVEAKARHQQKMQRLSFENKQDEEQIQDSLPSSFIRSQKEVKQCEETKQYHRKKREEVIIETEDIREIHSQEKYQYDFTNQNEKFEEIQNIQKQLFESKQKEEKLSQFHSSTYSTSQKQSKQIEEMKEQLRISQEEIQNLNLQLKENKEELSNKNLHIEQLLLQQKQESVKKEEKKKLSFLLYDKEKQRQLNELKEQLNNQGEQLNNQGEQERRIDELKKQLKDKETQIKNMNQQQQEHLKKISTLEEQCENMQVYINEVDSPDNSMIKEIKRQLIGKMNEYLLQQEKRLTLESSQLLANKQKEWDQQKQILENQISKMQHEQQGLEQQKQKRLKEILEVVEMKKDNTDEDFKRQLELLNPNQEVNQCQIEFVKQFSVVEQEQPTVEQVKVIEEKHQQVQQVLINSLKSNQQKQYGSMYMQQDQTLVQRGVLLMHQMLAEQMITTYITDNPIQQTQPFSRAEYQQKILQCGTQDSAFYFTANFNSSQEMEKEISEGLSLEKYIENFKNDMSKKLGEKDVSAENINIFAISTSPPCIKFQINSQNTNIKRKDFKSLGINVQTQNLLDKAELSINMFDPTYNQTWDNMSSQNDHRGSLHFYNKSGYIPQIYKFPIGYYGLGIRVLHLYGNDQRWIRSDTSPDTWIVLFHGTGHKNLKGILNQNNINPGKNNMYGGSKCRITGTIIKGGQNANTYLADDVLEAEPYSLQLNQVDSVPYSLVFQCRVNPMKVKSPESRPSYYTVENPLDDIRPYRLLIKQTR